MVSKTYRVVRELFALAMEGATGRLRRYFVSHQSAVDKAMNDFMSGEGITPKEFIKLYATDVEFRECFDVYLSQCGGDPDKFRAGYQSEYWNGTFDGTINDDDLTPDARAHLDRDRTNSRRRPSGA